MFIVLYGKLKLEMVPEEIEEKADFTCLEEDSKLA